MIGVGHVVAQDGGERPFEGASHTRRRQSYRYVEEALAETVAQVGVNGFRQFFTGIRFPVGNGYMYLTRPGGFDPGLAGAGLFPEGAALIYTGVVSGIAVELRFVAQPPPAREN